MNPPPGSHPTKVVAAAAIPALAVAWLVYSSASDKTFDWRLFRAALLEPVRAHPGLRHLLSATLIGYATLMALGDTAEMVRPYLIVSRPIVPFASQLLASIVERTYPLGLLAKRHLDGAEPLTAAFLDGVSFTCSQTATLRSIAYPFLNAFGRVLYRSWVIIAIQMGFVSFGSLVPLRAGGTQAPPCSC